MKKSHFELKNYVTATSVFVLAVVAGILIFFGCVQRSVQVNSQKTLKTVWKDRESICGRFWISIISI